MNFNELDQHIANFMQKFGIKALRISFAIIFIWFGILKPFHLSSAEELLKATVSWMPLFDANQWLGIIGIWEVVIGFLFLFKSTTRFAIALLFLQMGGTFLPLIMLPEITFQDGKFWLPTLEGQYIIKNIMIISAALVIGGTLMVKSRK